MLITHIGDDLTAAHLGSAVGGRGVDGDGEGEVVVLYVIDVA